MNAITTIRLVAIREIRQRLRSRLFVWTTIVLSVLMAVLALVPVVAGLIEVTTTDPEAPPEVVTVAVVGDLRAAERAALSSVLGRVELVEADHEEDARRRVADGDALLAVIEGERVLEAPAEGIFQTGIDHSLQVAEALAVAALLDDAGLDPDQVDDVLGVERLTIETVGDVDPADRIGRIILANVGVVFLFAVLTMYASMIVNGVIEEKGSRVVELLIEAVPVRHLMAGKLLGLGIVGLGQTAVLFGPATAIVVVAGTVALPGGGLGPLLLILGWFLGGYAFYSVVAAAFGALVSRPEEAQAVLTPASLLMVAGYLIGFFSVNAPDGPFATVAGWIPPTAPYVMLVRQLVGNPTAVEVVGSALLVLVATVLVAVLAARIYEGGILRTGSRMRLREAWKAARQ